MTGDDEKRMMEEDAQFIFPLVKLFANAMLMIGAPVTFFSLLKNFTDIYIISARNSAGRRLQVKTIITSVIIITSVRHFTSRRATTTTSTSFIAV